MISEQLTFLCHDRCKHSSHSAGAQQETVQHMFLTQELPLSMDVTCRMLWFPSVNEQSRF